MSFKNRRKNAKFDEENEKIGNSIFNREEMLTIFGSNVDIEERCKGVHCVDIGESFPTSIYLQNLASIQPRTSPKKFGKTGKRTSKFPLPLHQSGRVKSEARTTISEPATMPLEKHPFRRHRFQEFALLLVACLQLAKLKLTHLQPNDIDSHIPVDVLPPVKNITCM